MKRSRFLLPALVALTALGSALVALATAGGCAPVAEAPPAAPAAPPEPPFYQGKTLRLIVGLAPGGGYDTYYRLVAKHMGKHIPGNPATIVENMPGGGSLIAANHLYKVAKPDGLTVGTFLAGLVLQEAMGGEGIEFEARKFNWIGAPSRDTPICIVRADRGIKTAQDFLTSPTPVILGGTGPGAQMDDYSKVLQAALGANIKLVSGYGGTAPVRLAIERGEVDGACWGWESIKPTAADILAKGLVVPILATVEKHPDLPGVPSAVDLAKTEEGRQLLRVRSVPDTMNRPLAAPPGVPPERVALLRKAMVDTLKDPELLAEAEKAKIDVSVVTGEEVTKLVEEMFKTPPAVLKKLAEVLK